MFSFLVRIVGQYRAEVLRYYASEYAVLGIVAILAFAGMLSLFLFFNPERHVHDGYVIGDVAGVLHASSDTSNRFIVDVRLPDGSNHRLTTRHGSIMGSISDRACLERRRKESNGGMFYSLAPA
ncbi:hypothetical protein [Pseudophaeobacter sp.]|uniref:hypothetical protein n=1 Tax=Pseudophaeobacter sp. TaxID=1971739 RepID=UPI00329A78AF